MKTKIKFSIILIATLFLFNCTSVIDNDENVIKTKITQTYNLKTVPLNNSIRFLKQINNKKLTSKGIVSSDIDLYIDIESLEQVDLTNTDAKLNVATATTKFKSVETEFLQIEINGELQTVLFHYVPEKDLTMSNGISTKDDSFTGSVYSTDLDGIVLSGFEVNKGSITGEYRLPTSSTGPIPLNEVIIKNTYKAQTYYGGIYFNNSDYTRTPNYLNNYSSLGVAYAAYYKYLQTKKINDEIKDAKLKPCLKKILDNLKKTTASPGNMVVNFTGDWSTGYNWTVESGSIKGPAAGNTSSSFNMVSGTTTVFDSQKYPDATELSWARTMLHESIHAYLVTYFRLDGINANIKYSEMIRDWSNKINPDLNEIQHNEIARSFVKSIGDALEVYGISQGYNLSKEFYQDMAWAGLQDIKAFKELSSTEQKRILDTIATELTGMDIDGDYKSQKGKKSGC